MLYELAHTIQSRLPFLWDILEGINSGLFSLRYGRKLKKAASVLQGYSERFQIREAVISDVPNLVTFFVEQPEEAYTFFKPHAFDAKTIKKLIIRKSYLFFIVFDGEKIVGYYFLRCFFMGKSYLGKMVDVKCRGKGIGKIMCLSAMDVATTLGIHMFETISKDNLASLYSTQKVLDTRIIEEMPNNYLYIEDLPKGKGGLS